MLNVLYIYTLFIYPIQNQMFIQCIVLTNIIILYIDN